MALFVVVGGCTSTRSIESSDVVYDNRGGLAYAGLRITFHASGSYEVQSYSDVRGDDTVIERGTYKKQESAYALSHDGIQTVYRIVTVQGVEYLLDERRFDDYSRTRDSGTLRTAMRGSGASRSSSGASGAPTGGVSPTAPRPAIFSQGWPYGSPSSYLARKALIDNGTLHDGMTRAEAEAVLGPPTSDRNGVVDWYHNPDHLWHVAAYFRAEVRDGRLYKWETGNR